MRVGYSITGIALLLATGCADSGRPLEPITHRANAGSPPTWTTTYLPLPPNYGVGVVSDINRWGFSVGWAWNGIGTQEVAVGWSITVLTIIPQLPGTAGWDHRAMAINDAGTIVGYSRHNTATRMWKWSPTGGLVELFGPIGEATPEGINNAGVIVGHETHGTQEWAFKLSPNGSYEHLLHGADDAGALGINDAGYVTGYYHDPFLPGSTRKPVRWAPDGTALDLGSLGHPSGAGWGEAVSAQGYVVGTSLDRSGTERGFIYAGRVPPFVLSDLGNPPGWTGSSSAHDINASLRVVGTFNSSAWTVYQGIHVVLPKPDLTTGWASAVNQCGWIVGWIDISPVLWRPSACDI